ncbi:hypothetical protein [aff. Roholtiella sp. LEGE 12411]|uniref:hypothetical protein n=1 Tax=aff. Roholtiella sp. LEGE 12411 TaxID=1828822 RepID=UPI001882D28C|nr:hypothetical protein [aff. Roholtiella sp. LEGE 12411]MBE9037188.1 hypothetical protein [aff. Roholtiella sp. LEGE 12411]
MVEIKVDDMRAAGKPGYVAKIVNGEKKFLNAAIQDKYSSSKVAKIYKISEDGIYEICDANFGGRKRRINFIKVEDGEIIEESENLNSLITIEKTQLLNIEWVSDIDDENAHEFRGDEGHFEGDAYLPNGKKQRVEVCGEEKPKDFESQNNDPIMDDYAEYRSFLARDGKRYWCRPLLSVDFAIWADIIPDTVPRNFSAPKPINAVDVISSAPKRELPELIEKPDCKIAIAGNVNGELLFFTVEFDRDLGYMFGVLLAAVKRISGRKWNDLKKRWEVPIENADELKKELIEYYGDSAKSSSATFSLSPRTRELLYSQGIPSLIEENVK